MSDDFLDWWYADAPDRPGLRQSGARGQRDPLADVPAPGHAGAYLAKIPLLVNPLLAAGQLVALKAWVREAMTGEPAYPDGAARHDEAGGAARDGAAGGAAADPGQVPVAGGDS